MKISTRDMILVSFFATLTIVGAKVSISLLYVPISLQLVFCCFAGILLGAKLGMLSQLIYMIIGLIGIPVFSKPIAGPQYILQPSFGYIIGFIVAAYVIGYIREKYNKIVIAVLCGIMIDYIIGVSYMYLIINLYIGKSMSLQGALAAGFVPFIVKDIVAGIIVSAIAAATLPALKGAGLLKVNTK
ncbi:MAG: biotin transporter BioY [Clostridiaceae bacterium]|nr:biotin transporter BioY [Clostridiaceae bacterium]